IGRGSGGEKKEIFGGGAFFKKKKKMEEIEVTAGQIRAERGTERRTHDERRAAVLQVRADGVTSARAIGAGEDDDVETARYDGHVCVVRGSSPSRLAARGPHGEPLCYAWRGGILLRTGPEVHRGRGKVRVRGFGLFVVFFFFSSRRRHTRLVSDWSSDVCSSD